MMNYVSRQSNKIGSAWTNDEEHEEIVSQQQAQIKQGWSLLSTHHCLLLPDKIDVLGLCRNVIVEHNFEFDYFRIEQFQKTTSRDDGKEVATSLY